MARTELKKTALGLLLIALAVLVVLTLTALGIATEIGLVSQRSLTSVLRYGGLGAHLLAIAGYALCLTSPRQAADKSWLFASLGLFAAVVVAVLAADSVVNLLFEGGNFGLAVRVLTYYAVLIHVLELIGLGCFLAWLRSLALSLESRRHAKWALDLIKTGAAIAVVFLGVGAFVVLREPPILAGNQMDNVGFVLGLLIPGTFIGLLIWLISLAWLLFGVWGLLLSGQPLSPAEPAAAVDRGRDIGL